jgi:uncharacterized protein (TIGR00106 family)
MLVAFSVTPLGVGEAVAEYVADAVRVVRDSGLENRTDAMFTTIEGDWDEVMDVVKRAVEAVAARAPRVSLTLKADVRPAVTGALEAKVESLERYLAGGPPPVPAATGTASISAASPASSKRSAGRTVTSSRT